MDKRIRIVFGVFCILFIIIICRLWYIQVLHKTKYTEMSFRNRTRLVQVPSARGIIYDRKGRIVVDNKAALQLVVIAGSVSNEQRLTDELSGLVKLSPDYILKKIKENIFRPFAASVLASDMNDSALVNVAESRWHLPGIAIQAAPIRDYLYGEIYSHVIGYVGEAGKIDLESGYSWGDIVGRFGIERDWDRGLRGKNGYREVQVDYRGNVDTVLGMTEPETGTGLYLTIDHNLQEELFNAMKTHRGSGIVMNPNTGEILAVVSVPGFNPNLLVSPVKENVITDLFKNRNNPMVNRSVSGLYPPGSIFKIIVALAALEEGVITKKSLFYCDGEFKLGSTKFRCWEKKGHGWMDLLNSLKKSCNEYFYQIGLKTGPTAISDMASRFGFGKKTNIRISGEREGFLPTKEMLDSKWFRGDTVNLSIGHGKILVTPVQTACFVSAIANGGTLYRPRITVNEQEEKMEINIKKEYIDYIKEGLFRVVNEPDGTGHSVFIDGLSIAGKTGTVELKEGGKKRDICWFVGFAPFINPRIAVVIVVEEGESGGITAGPIAKKVIKKWLKDGN